MESRDVRETIAKTITPAVSNYLRNQNESDGLWDGTEDGGFAVYEKPLHQFRRVSDADVTIDESISIVICTRDRPEFLARCLGSVRQLQPAPTEVLVVDNAPTSNETKALVATMPDVRYVLEPRAGLDYARNAGVTHSSGQIVAFLDDDVTVPTSWVQRIVKGFASGADAITGLVIPTELDSEAQDIFEKHWGFNRGYLARDFNDEYFQKYIAEGVPAWEIGAGANMAFRRQVFETIGLFDVRLDVGAAGCSGDSEIWYRILANGGKCRYEPAAVVFHTHRQDFYRLKNQLHNYMRGHVAALLIQFERHRHWGNLRRLFLTLPWYYLKLIVNRARGYQKQRYKTIVSELTGCFSGIIFYLRNMSLSGRGRSYIKPEAGSNDE